MTSTLLKPSFVPRLNLPVVRRHPNGLTVIAEQMPIEAVNLSVWFKAGSAIELDGINGMAHFLEHMVFKGTTQIQSGEFERLVEERGAITNAATSQDYTHYYITTAPQDFADLAPLQLEVALNAAIPDEAFERERSVILEEIRRSHDNPRRRIFQQSLSMAFETLPYRRPVLGPAEVVSQLTPQQMRDFHQTWYRPDRMTVVAVGNLPVEALIETVETSLRSTNLESPTCPPHREVPSLTPEPVFTTIQRQEITDPTLQQARLMMIWRVPGLIDLDKTLALDVLSNILGQGRTARLIRDLREERGLVSAISVSNLTYQTQGTFYISAQLPLENVPAVEAAIVEHIRQLQAEPVAESEITRIRTQVANRFVFGNETPSDRANLYGYYDAIVGDLTVAFNYPAHVQALSVEDLQSAAQAYLSPDAYGVVLVKPKD
ncbi:MAG: pitrilysin family protein [Leptolyngbyaceae cyanobacterium bins.59]|nr:pitrilysin family protein [Leptolyngbyaceae cyanobacterium bins.59]